MKIQSPIKKVWSLSVFSTYLTVSQFLANISSLRRSSSSKYLAIGLFEFKFGLFSLVFRKDLKTGTRFRLVNMLFCFQIIFPVSFQRGFSYLRRQFSVRLLAIGLSFRQKLNLIHSLQAKLFPTAVCGLSVSGVF